MVFDEIIHSDQGSTKVYAEEYDQNITLEKLESCLEKQPIYSTKQQVEILQQEELPKEWRIPRDLSVDNIIGCKWVFRNKLDESEVFTRNKARQGKASFQPGRRQDQISLRQGNHSVVPRYPWVGKTMEGATPWEGLRSR